MGGVWAWEGAGQREGKRLWDWEGLRERGRVKRGRANGRGVDWEGGEAKVGRANGRGVGMGRGGAKAGAGLKEEGPLEGVGA